MVVRDVVGADLVGGHLGVGELDERVAGVVPVGWVTIAPDIPSAVQTKR